MTRIISHPVILLTLWALHPVLLRYVRNADLVTWQDLLLPMVLAGMAAILLYLVFFLFSHDRAWASILTWMGLMALFPVEPMRLCSRLATWTGWWAVISLAGVLLVLSGLLVRHAQRARWDIRPLLLCLGLMGLMLVLMNLVTLGSGFLQRTRRPRITIPVVQVPDLKPAEALLETPPPDIYYLVLDGFGSPDVVRRVAGYDLAPFITFLRKQGFQVIEQGHANYCQTILSIASSLNMSLLPDAPEVSPGAYRRALMAIIRHNNVAAALSSLGYRTVVVASGYSGTSHLTADRTIKPWWAPDEFTMCLLGDTLPGQVGQLAAHLPRLRNMAFDPRVPLHAARLRHAFAHLPLAATSSQPVFLFAHILTPHPPFVLDRYGHTTAQQEHVFDLSDGSHAARTREAYAAGYREQVMYAASQVEQIVTAIQNRPDREAVIILQGDHGPGSGLDWSSLERTDLDERLSILNAICVPDRYRLQPWPGLTPVNTFRLLFNTLFNAHMVYETDASFYSPWDHPADFSPLQPNQLHPDTP